MALSSYSSLKAAIADWLARDGDTALAIAADDFIDLAEARHRRELRLRSMEQRATATLSGAYLALPNDFLELRNIQLDTDPLRSLDCMSPEMLDRLYPQSQTGEPGAYAILGNELQFAPAPDGDYTVEIDYWKRFTALDDANTSNWLLVNAPAVYLYSCLAEAARYIADEAAEARFEAAYGRAMDLLRVADRRSAFSGASLRMRPRVVV